MLYHDHSKLGGIVAKVTLVQKNVCVRTFNNTDNREKEIKKRKSEERKRKKEKKEKVEKVISTPVLCSGAPGLNFGEGQAILTDFSWLSQFVQANSGILS